MDRPSFGGLLRRPLVVAPMAGGPTTAELVIAAGRAGAFGFLAGGNKTVAAMRDEIAVVRGGTTGAFGINLFVPGQPAGDRAGIDRYVACLDGEPGEPAWDDDGFDAKIAALLDDPVPAVSFTFGCPDRAVVAGLREAGSLVAVTVTSPAEAAVAAGAGADALIVQGFEAGGHRGTFANDDAPGADYGLLALIGAVASVTGVPLIAAGGVMTASQLTAVLAAGAIAAQCGTAFLRSAESGAHPVHKAALADPRFTATALTRAFSGRLARGLVNEFMAGHQAAPAAYPEINNATRPLRAAAAASGDAERMSLWAGQGFKAAADAPAARIIEQLCADVPG